MKPIPFDDDLERDWPGAESWPDGKPPLYQSGTFANGEGYEIIFDKNGAHLYPEDASAAVLHFPQGFKSQQEAIAFANKLNAPKSEADFVHAGFAPDEKKK
jgi:hypothetical protein